MTLGKIAGAREAVLELGAERLPYGMAAAVAALDRAIEPLVEMYAKEELRLLNAYGVRQGEGWRIPPEAQADYLAELRALRETEAPLQWTPARVKPPAEIRVNTLRKLEDFILWEE